MEVPLTVTMVTTYLGTAYHGIGHKVRYFKDQFIWYLILHIKVPVTEVRYILRTSSYDIRYFLSDILKGQYVDGSMCFWIICEIISECDVTCLTQFWNQNNKAPHSDANNTSYMQSKMASVAFFSIHVFFFLFILDESRYLEEQNFYWKNIQNIKKLFSFVFLTSFCCHRSSKES